MRVIDRAGVEQLFPMAEAIPVVEQTMRALNTGEIVQPLRTVIRAPHTPVILGGMPAFVGVPRAGFGIKAVTVAPAGLAPETHQGVVLVFDPETGTPRGILDAGSITEIRTAAASAVATGLLAAPDADTLAIIGTGAQARAHFEAMTEVRRFRRFTVWGRTPDRARAFANWADARFGVTVEVTGTAHEAAVDADVVCTATSSATPVLAADDVKAGAHVNAVGACLPAQRELTTDLMVKATLVVDSAVSAFAESGDLLIPIEEGALAAPESLTELGQILRGEAAGRAHADEITVYKSLGLAAQDVASALYITERADETDLGTVVKLS